MYDPSITDGLYAQKPNHTTHSNTAKAFFNDFGLDRCIRSTFALIDNTIIITHTGVSDVHMCVFTCWARRHRFSSTHRIPCLRCFAFLCQPANVKRWPTIKRFVVNIEMFDHNVCLCAYLVSASSMLWTSQQWFEYMLKANQCVLHQFCVSRGSSEVSIDSRFHLLMSKTSVCVCETRKVYLHARW